jgi:hypothetical protein
MASSKEWNFKIHSLSSLKVLTNNRQGKFSSSRLFPLFTDFDARFSNSLRFTPWRISKRWSFEYCWYFFLLFFYVWNSICGINEANKTKNNNREKNDKKSIINLVKKRKGIAKKGIPRLNHHNSYDWNS